MLAVVSPRLGHLYPLVPTLAELVRGGHRVAIRVPPGEIPYLRALGLDAKPGDATWIDDSVQAQRRVAQLRESIMADRPDLLVIDASVWEAGAVAEASGVGWAYAAPFCLPIPSREVPPFGLGLRPRPGVVGWVRDAFVRLAFVRPFERRVSNEINYVRKQLHLSPISAPSDIFLRAPLVLCYTSEPFEYHRSSWPSNVRMVGPGVWDPPQRPPRWLVDLLDSLILVTSSSVMQGEDLLARTAVDALGETDLAVVVTSPKGDLHHLPCASNVRVATFASHSNLVRRARCVVCHGGMGITQKALVFGVPVCAVPFNRDQFEVARRVQVAGVGSTLKSSRLNPRRLRVAVDNAIACRVQAQNLAAAFASAGGPRRAATELIALAQG